VSGTVQRRIRAGGDSRKEKKDLRRPGKEEYIKQSSLTRVKEGFPRVPRSLCHEANIPVGTVIFSPAAGEYDSRSHRPGCGRIPSLYRQIVKTTTSALRFGRFQF